VHDDMECSHYMKNFDLHEEHIPLRLIPGRRFSYFTLILKLIQIDTQQETACNNKQAFWHIGILSSLVGSSWRDQISDVIEGFVR
jgi:hypothetical protein